MERNRVRCCEATRIDQSHLSLEELEELIREEEAICRELEDWPEM